MSPWFLLAALCLGAPPSPTFTGSVQAEIDLKQGWKLVYEGALDLGLGAKSGPVVIQQKGSTLRLQAFEAPKEDPKESAKAFSRAAQFVKRVGQRVHIRKLVKVARKGEPPELWMLLRSEAPDETLDRALILSLKDRRFVLRFEHLFVVEKQNTQKIYGADLAPPGLSIVPVKGGEQELRFTGAVIPLELPGYEDDIQVAVAVREQRFRRDPKTRRYKPLPDRTRDLYQPLAMTGAEVNLRSRDGDPATSWVTDQNAATGWRIPRGAERPSLALHLKDPSEIRLIRVVPNCRNAEAQGYDRIRQLRIWFGGGQRMDLWTDRDGPFPPWVLGIGRFPLESGEGEQILVFLREGLIADGARVEVVDSKPNAKRGVLLKEELCFADFQLQG